jgi:peroxiredoxin
MADISSLYADYEAKGFRFVSVSLDDNPEELHNAVASKGLKGDLLFAPDGGSAEVASFYGVSSLPEYILINREGTIIARSSSVADIKNKIEEVF